MSYLGQLLTVWTPVDSSVLRSVGYNGSTLAIEFQNGRVYEHPHVPYEVYHGLLSADSKGAFYNHYIRGKYK
jgi:hypothetical protein